MEIADKLLNKGDLQIKTEPKLELKSDEIKITLKG